MRALLASLALSVAAGALPAAAQDAATPPQPVGAPAASGAVDPFAVDTITVGVGGVYLPDYEGSNDYRWTPAPAALGSINGYAFQLAGNRLSVDVIRNPPGPIVDLQVGPLVVVNFNRTNNDNIDSPRVRIMDERKTAIEVGGFVGIAKTGVVTSDYDKLSASLSYREDVAGAHGSGIWQPSVSYATPLSMKAGVGLFASAERVGGGYGRYYLGVSAAEAQRTGLPVYSPGGGWKNYTLGGLATYSITGNLLRGIKVVAGGTYQRLLGDFGDSPIVSRLGSRNQWLGTAGLAYTF